MPSSSGTATVTLPSDTQILIVREFDAPVPLVWKAWTTPELVRRWWAGERGEVTLAEIDFRVGGGWRYVMVAHGDFEVAFNGVYQEIAEHERIVNTEIFEGMADARSLVTNSFVDLGDRTRMEMLIDHDSKEARDGHINSGMEGGMQESMDRLEQVARSLA
ncbi:SRPBCC family protein [Conexibacter sp. JD483]|uniref:SRPBCC family protein n=1 Tax=unclassified Conexibacter TaxID=2627773 RepID=UPI00271C5249|nr:MULTISPECIES: SRPBCC family protein [unclassified Conexibacter]MDO8187479.1 SRPBCC family protein [Conexibacter sp. CPCC 205706]MDO8198713.1 SRPBCC family protein [Conexibacter sp. CPCC 205762]MDR9372413.1 SRPBCC family protein [Conexibacter sp. JD483]